MNSDEARNLAARDLFATLVGVEIMEAGPGYCKACLKVEDRHLNAAKVVQGGAIFTLADLAFAVASNSRGRLALAINVNISFLNGVTTGTLYATATEVDKPKRLGAYDVIVTDDSEQIVARFNGLVYRKDQPVS